MATKSECIAVSEAQNLAVPNGLKLSFQFRVPQFRSLYLSNHTELDFDTLRKVGDIA